MCLLRLPDHRSSGIASILLVGLCCISFAGDALAQPSEENVTSIESYGIEWSNTGQRFRIVHLRPLYEGEPREIYLFIKNGVSESFSSIEERSGCRCAVLQLDRLKSIAAQTDFVLPIQLRPMRPDLNQTVGVFGVDSRGDKVQLLSIYLYSAVSSIVHVRNPVVRRQSLSEMTSVRVDLTLNSLDWELDLAKAVDLSGNLKIIDYSRGPEPESTRRTTSQFLSVSWKDTVAVPLHDSVSVIAIPSRNMKTGESRTFEIPIQLVGGHRFRSYPSLVSLRPPSEDDKHYSVQVSVVNRTGSQLDCRSTEIEFLRQDGSVQSSFTTVADGAGSFEFTENPKTGVVSYRILSTFPTVIPTHLRLKLKTVPGDDLSSGLTKQEIDELIVVLSHKFIEDEME